MVMYAYVYSVWNEIIVLKAVQDVPDPLEELPIFLLTVVNILIKQIIIMEGIPFEAKMCCHVYSAEEVVNKVRKTIAFEDMDLTKENTRMVDAYKNRDVSEDDLCQEILGGVK